MRDITAILAKAIFDGATPEEVRIPAAFRPTDRMSLFATGIWAHVEGVRSLPYEEAMALAGMVDADIRHERTRTPEGRG